jgi:hypothetical protein
MKAFVQAGAGRAAHACRSHLRPSDSFQFRVLGIHTHDSVIHERPVVVRSPVSQFIDFRPRKYALSGVATREEFADFGDDIADSDRAVEHVDIVRKHHRLGAGGNQNRGDSLD